MFGAWNKDKYKKAQFSAVIGFGYKETKFSAVFGFGIPIRPAIAEN